MFQNDLTLAARLEPPTLGLQGQLFGYLDGWIRDKVIFQSVLGEGDTKFFLFFFFIGAHQKDILYKGQKTKGGGD